MGFTRMRKQFGPSLPSCPVRPIEEGVGPSVANALLNIPAMFRFFSFRPVSSFRSRSSCFTDTIWIFRDVITLSRSAVAGDNDVISWTAMIVGHAEHGHSKEAFELFEEMCRVGLKPDHVTFIGVLTACSHAGEVELGLRYLNAMNKTYGLEPEKEHYGCVVDLLARAGRIHEAEELIGRIAADGRDGVVWTSLLRACAARGAEETGKKAAERMMEAEPWGSGAHVAMANLYASKGQWREAAQERHLMKQKGVLKGAGWSSVEVGGDDRGVGVFVSGDRTNPHDNAIYMMLELIYYGAGMVRQIPDQLDLVSEVELTVSKSS